MQIKCEFHCHSIASDGKLTPPEIIEIAKNKNLKLISLTDHDTTKGLKEASIAAKDLGIKFIPGIELSCDYKGSTIHLLGYFKDNSYTSKELQDFLQNLEDNRVQRAIQIVNNLKKYFNIQIDYKKVLENGKGVIARPHIAQTIIEAGYNYDFEYIFDKFIGDDSPAYVPNKKLDVRDGIKLLKKFNALVILAHPKLIKKVNVEEVLSFDINGVEAIYFQNTKQETNFFTTYAVKNNLLITCGSDCHGNSINEDKKHGQIGDMDINSIHLNKFLDLYNS